MPREIKVYPPEVRRFISENLLCPACGNTSAFMMDLRLRHSLQIQSKGLEVSLDRVPTEKILKALALNLHKVLDKGFYEDKPRIACANCGETDYIDLLERVMDTCWNSGCPGCSWCGSYIEKEELVNLCSDCITSKDGEVTTETCECGCPNYDYGLDEVRNHYGITLEGLKQDLGYQVSAACKVVE